MIKDMYILKSSPIFLLSNGEEVEINLELENIKPVPVNSQLKVKVKRKSKKIIVKGRTRPYAILWVKFGNSPYDMVAADSKGHFIISRKQRNKKKLIVTIKDFENIFTVKVK